MFELESKRLENEIKALISRYPSDINTELENFLFAKSKRIRSRLVFLFTKALFAEVNDDVIKLAALIEILHAATLIHDDIVDSASYRRGLETFNSKYDSKFAVLMGDLLLTIVNHELLQLNNPQIFAIFTSEMTNLCLGELRQYSSKGAVPTFKEYVDKSKTKTSSLFIASLKSLVILLNKSSAGSGIVNFAINFGIAFQIRDDLMNFLGVDDLKPTMSDFNNKIYSAPVLFYLQKGKKLAYFTYAFRSDKTLREELINLTCDMIKEYSNKAISSLNVLYESNYKKEIENLCKELWRLDYNV